MAKKKETKKEQANDYILIDRSGSMGDKWNETLGAINSYVEQIKKDKSDSVLTVATFDSSVNMDFEIIRDHVPLDKWTNVTEADATPRGGTPLYDAASRMINIVQADNPKRAVIVIVTDGHENASREVNHIAIKGAVDACKAKGWEVIFMGADFVADGQAKDFGLGMNKVVNTVAGNYGATMAGLSTMRSSYAATGDAMCIDDSFKVKAGKK